MTNPVLVEVTRGAIVESRHRGRVVVVDGDGKVVFSQGDIETAIFPRSANKAMQALPLIESGAADAFGFGNKELALAAASHDGEPAHVETALKMVAAAGRGEDAFECGAHWSGDIKTMVDQVRHYADPTPAMNNCSGKHAGFICTACHNGIDPKGYVGYDHPIQRDIRGVMENLTGVLHGHANCGTDGCSIPTYAVEMKALAFGFAKMATGNRLEPVRAKASRRIIEACMAEPFQVAGTRGNCTAVMKAAPGRVFVKYGAEGVYCAAIPELGLAMAMKCDDGAERAANVMVAGVLARFFEKDSEVQANLRALSRRDILSRNRVAVGEIRVSEALTA